MEQVPLFDWIGPLIAVSILVPIIITGAVIGLIVWAIRRSMPPEPAHVRIWVDEAISQVAGDAVATLDVGMGPVT